MISDYMYIAINCYFYQVRRTNKHISWITSKPATPDMSLTCNNTEYSSTAHDFAHLFIFMQPKVQYYKFLLYCGFFV